MHYPVLKVSVLALLASAGLHAAIGWLSVSNGHRSRLGVSEGQGGAAGQASRRVLQAEVQLTAPQAPASPSARDTQNDLPPVPDPDTAMPLAVTASPSAEPSFEPPALPAPAAPRPRPLTVSHPPSIGSAGTLTAKQPASGDGGVQTSSPSALLNNPSPLYPSAARAKGQEGRVLLTVTVSASGTVSDVRVKKSSGHPTLDEAALTAVRKWKFKPAVKNGAAMEEVIDQPVVFSLRR